MLGLGEAMSLRAGGDITPAAAELFERAVTLAPDNPKALLYGGFAAATRGDRAAGAQPLAGAERSASAGRNRHMLDERIAELGPPGPSVAGGAAPGNGPPTARPRRRRFERGRGAGDCQSDALRPH